MPKNRDPGRPEAYQPGDILLPELLEALEHGEPCTLRGMYRPTIPGVRLFAGDATGVGPSDEATAHGPQLEIGGTPGIPGEHVHLQSQPVSRWNVDVLLHPAIVTERPFLVVDMCAADWPNLQDHHREFLTVFATTIVVFYYGAKAAHLKGELTSDRRVVWDVCVVSSDYSPAYVYSKHGNFSFDRSLQPGSDDFADVVGDVEAAIRDSVMRLDKSAQES